MATWPNHDGGDQRPPDADDYGVAQSRNSKMPLIDVGLVGKNRPNELWAPLRLVLVSGISRRCSCEPFAGGLQSADAPQNKRTRLDRLRRGWILPSDRPHASAVRMPLPSRVEAGKERLGQYDGDAVALP
jgi:hypothetical protein